MEYFIAIVLIISFSSIWLWVRTAGEYTGSGDH